MTGPSGPLTPDEVAATPQPPPADAPPLPLPTTGTATRQQPAPAQQSGQSESSQQSPGQQGSGQQGSGDGPPPGYTKPGQGMEDLDPDGDGALRPERANQVAEEEQKRTSAAAAGGFKLDADAMRSLKPEWEEVAKEMQDLTELARNLGLASPPAEDEASRTQLQAVIQHAKNCGSISEEMFQYADEYARAIGKAIDNIESADRAAGDSARDAGRDV